MATGNIAFHVSDGPEGFFYLGSPTNHLYWNGEVWELRGPLHADDINASDFTAQTINIGIDAVTVPASGITLSTTYTNVSEVNTFMFSVDYDAQMVGKQILVMIGVRGSLRPLDDNWAIRVSLSRSVDNVNFYGVDNCSWDATPRGGIQNLYTQVQENFIASTASMVTAPGTLYFKVKTEFKTASTYAARTSTSSVWQHSLTLLGVKR